MQQSVGGQRRINPFLRSWRRLAALAVIFGIVIVGAVGQAGALTPKVWVGQESAGGPGNLNWTSVQNVSWRSWRILGLSVVRLKAQQAQTAADFRLALVRQQPGSSATFGTDAVKALDVSAGHTFYIEAMVPAKACAGQSFSPQLTVGIEVATPLGQRMVAAAMPISCNS
jgi:hypothetical protein